MVLASPSRFSQVVNVTHTSKPLRPKLPPTLLGTVNAGSLVGIEIINAIIDLHQCAWSILFTFVLQEASQVLILIIY